MAVAPSVPDGLRRFAARFDRGEYWLAHEELEELWLRDRRDLYKGLIQLAAAFVHVERGNWRGARTKTASALKYLEADDRAPTDIDLPSLRRRATALHRHLERLVASGEGGFDDACRFRLAPMLDWAVDPDSVEEEELPYRVRRHDEGYRTRRDPKRRD